MSFILDALKKSETERQQQSQAEFSTVPSAPAQPRSARWLWILAALLLINVAVLIGILTRPDLSSDAATSNDYAAERQDLPTPTAPAAETFEDRVARAVEAQPTVEPQVADPEPVAVSTSDVPTTPAATILSGGSNSVSVPTIDQLRLNGSLSLGQMHLDIHVFSEDPTDRFVFINMSKYRENERTAEGAVVSEITRDGVILSHQGQRFLLPRE